MAVIRFTFLIYLFLFLNENNTNAQWVQAGLTDTTVYTLALSYGEAGESNLFAGTTRDFNSTACGVFRSTNNGTSWTALGLTNLNILSLTSDLSGNLFAGTHGNGVFLTTDNGTNWISINTGLTNYVILSLKLDLSENLFAGTVDGVFLSTNKGKSWTKVSTGLTNNHIRDLAVIPNGTGGTNLFAGTYGGGVFISTNNGTSWTAANTGLTNNFVWCFAVSEMNLFAGTNDGVFLSTNSGTSWTEVGLTNKVWCFAVSDINLFAGGGGIFHTTNNGTTWTAVNTGLTDTSILSLAIWDKYIFAGTREGGVWRRPLHEIIPVELTSFTANAIENNIELTWITATEINNSGFRIERKSSGTEWNGIAFVEGHGTTTETKAYSFIDRNLNPGFYSYRLKQIDFDGTFEYSKEIEVDVFATRTFALEQNYPNPFNPSTTISWQSPVASHQTLKVYDLLGREIATLVDEYKPSGNYEVEFDANNLSSGTYFYRLRAGDFIEIKKLLLLK